MLLFEHEFFLSPVQSAQIFLRCALSRMMKLVQKKRRGESEKLSINGKVKQAKKSIGGGIQSGLRAFFSIPSAGAKQNTPPTSPEERDSDIEIIEIHSDSSKNSKKRKKVFDCVEVTKKP